MTKITQGEFESDTITKVETPKTKEQKLAEWKIAHLAEFEVAREACCVCTPTRAQALLVDQYEGYSPIDF